MAEDKVIHDCSHIVDSSVPHFYSSFVHIFLFIVVW